MLLKGQNNFKASPQLLWAILMDPIRLARITPGISRLESTGLDTFDAIVDIKMGPVKGSFKGQMAVAEKEEPRQFLLKIQQNSKIGNVAAAVNIFIKPVNEQETELSFNGDAKLSGPLAQLGSRVIGPVANVLTKQFFKGMRTELTNTPPIPGSEYINLNKPVEAQVDKVKPIIENEIADNTVRETNPEPKPDDEIIAETNPSPNVSTEDISLEDQSNETKTIELDPDRNDDSINKA